MLSWLVKSALKQRVPVLAMAALLVVLGLRASADVPLDVFPEFAPPIVEIQTEAPGLSTEEVESLITVPIETAVNGVPDLATLRSKSVLGLSSVTILFERGTDVIRARQLVQERVTQVQGAPSICCAPARNAASPVIHQSCAQNWHLVEETRPNGTVRAGALDDSAQADVCAGRRQRRRVGLS
jgi:Cu/Ag efflux pump CusA